jgi:hypothetical protein
MEEYFCDKVGNVGFAGYRTLVVIGVTLGRMDFSVQR